MDLNKLFKNLDFKKIKYGNTNLSVYQVMDSETKRLKKIIEEKINDYYENYEPKVYRRTNALKRPVSINNLDFKVVGNRITCSLYVNDNAIHDSIINDGQGNAFWLMNDGWEVGNDVWFHNIANFGYREGEHFLEDAIEEFESTSKYNIKVDVERPLIYYT